MERCPAGLELSTCGRTDGRGEVLCALLQVFVFNATKINGDVNIYVNIYINVNMYGNIWIFIRILHAIQLAGLSA